MQKKKKSSEHLGRLMLSDKRNGLQGECVWAEMGMGHWKPETKPQSTVMRSSSAERSSGNVTSFRNK